MRWIKYAVAEKSRWGIVEGDFVAEVSESPFAGPALRTGEVHRLAAVRIEIPFIPRTFYAAGLNYTAHIKEMAAAAIPEKPDMGYRAVNALIAHEEPVVIPRDATKIQYEGELAVVIGRKAKHLSESEALSCVLGYTIGNDVSERAWQRTDRTFWRAKNTDTFKPMGPWIETDLDLDAAETIVRLNGQVTSHFRTNAMLFGIAKFISTMTRNLTLWPGDVIWMGTDGTSPDLKPGDVVEIEITGLGTLRNPFIAEP